MNQFLKVSIPVDSSLNDILIAELGDLHYDSFEEMEEELHAYVKESLFDRPALTSVLVRYGISGDFKVEIVDNINWNEQWEKNFDPVFIPGEVQIRATFHPPQPEYKYDIVINPKMSFGTGHHETTYLIVTEQLHIDHTAKAVLDVGTGTGILAIMAHKLGASSITATDVDDWCIENCRENFGMNGLAKFDILQGTIDKLTLPGNYDIIFANINKNVLMDEMVFYHKLLSDKGLLVLSGFYDHDAEDIIQQARALQLGVKTRNSKNRWTMITLNKEKS
jgi:ribosomal protein L11 methyltransferase